MKKILNQLIGGHNSVLQELFVIRNNQSQVSRFNDIEKSLTKLTDLVIPKSSSSSTPSTPICRSAHLQKRREEDSHCEYSFFLYDNLIHVVSFPLFYLTIISHRSNLVPCNLRTSETYVFMLTNVSKCPLKVVQV